MNYFDALLAAYGFTPEREGFYTRPTAAKAGGTLYCLVGEDGLPRKLLLWQDQRVLLQGDSVTLEALEEVLRQVLPVADLPPQSA